MYVNPEHSTFYIQFFLIYPHFLSTYTGEANQFLTINNLKTSVLLVQKNPSASQSLNIII
jgi:hypothetical protein